jgi:O-antigen ligase
MRVGCVSNNVRYRLMALEPWLILALTPFFIFPNAWTPWAVLALPLLWLARSVLSRGRWARRRPAHVPLLLLCLTIFPALRVAPDMAAARTSLLYLLPGIALCWALVQGRLGCIQADLWTAALLGMAIFLAVLLPLAMPGLPANLPWSAAVTARLPAAWRERVNPNVLGGGLALLVPFALAALVGRPFLSRDQEGPAPPGWGSRAADAGLRAVALLALLASLAALILTRSRGALLATLGGVGLLAILDWTATRRWWLPALLVMAVGLGLFAAPFLAHTLPAPDSEETLTLAGRLPIWEAVLRMLGRAPLTGVGLGNFQRVMARDEPGADPARPQGANHAHNLFLQVAADLGVVGCVAFMALYGLSLRAAYRAWRAGGGRLAMGLIGGLSAAGLHGMVDAVQWGTKPAFLLWLFMGLALSLDLE